MSRAIARMPCAVKTITLDNGTEFQGYEVIKRVHGVLIYFATPYHSGGRGTNKNSNGLIRQYLPEDTSMKETSQLGSVGIETKQQTALAIRV